VSGGSWDYVYNKFDETAARLLNSKDPLRRALGLRISYIANAMHDIEWVDSGDYGEGKEIEAIRKALGKNARSEVLKLVIINAENMKRDLEKAIQEARKEYNKIKS
jgi:hypothetical protein